MRAVRAPEREEVAAAAERIRPQLAPTPHIESTELAGGAILKLETFQPTGSFKVRGALNALALLDPLTPVVCASAGNHGLGVAWAAERLGRRATVVVAETASPAKVEVLRRFAVELVLHGAGYDEAEAHALDLAAAGARFVSPYNDPDVVAGAGTVALELLEELAGPLTIVVPVGGGGLASGVGLWASGFPEVRVIGVETAASRAVGESVAAGAVVQVETAPTLADGLAGNLEPGTVTLELVRRHLQGLVAVTETELETAMRFLVREHGLVAEGAGAAAVAALLAGKVPAHGRAVALVTGRNVAAATLAAVLARGPD